MTVLTFCLVGVLIVTLSYTWKQTIPFRAKPKATAPSSHTGWQKVALAGRDNNESAEPKTNRADQAQIRVSTQSAAQTEDEAAASTPGLNANSGDLMPEQGPPLPSIPDRTREEVKKRGLVEMASFQTHFAHAIPSQAKNIALAASRIDLRIVQPGQVFSYNLAAGPFDRSNGYGLGRMFSGNRIVPSIGGGVCQVSSTLYNAVLRADLPVVERHPHSLTVPYLQPGRDATVLDGVMDFRFRNNLTKPILISSSTQGRWVWVRLYGPEKSAPVRLESKILARVKPWTERIADSRLAAGQTQLIAPGQEGFTVQTWKIVKSPQGDKRIDLGVNVYKPSPRLIHYGK